MMRQRRNRKFIYVFAFQLLFMYCGLLFWTLKFESETNAAYNDVKQISWQITADWKNKDKDKPKNPELSFIKQEVQCKNGSISAVIRNNSQSIHMKHSAVYEVYWSERGNPKPENGGQKVHSGTVPALRAGESYTISFKVTKQGQYIFKVSYLDEDFFSSVMQVDKKCIDKSKPPKGKHHSTLDVKQPENEQLTTEENVPPHIEASESEEIYEQAIVNEQMEEEGKEGLDEGDSELD